VAVVVAFYTSNQSADKQEEMGHIRWCLCVQQTDLQRKHKVKGVVSNYQCVSVLQTCSSDVRELIAAVDRKGTGYISYDDFEAVMARSLLQHTRPVEAAVDLSATIRLQPDSSALPFHEVPISLSNTLDLLVPISCSLLILLYYLPTCMPSYHMLHHVSSHYSCAFWGSSACTVRPI